MTLFPEPQFSGRKFPGLINWLWMFVLSSWLGAGIAFLGGYLSDGRWGTLTDLILVQPMFRLVFVLTFVVILARATRVSLSAALQGVTPWILPLQLLPGIIDLALRSFGLGLPQSYYLNGIQLPLSWVSLGLAPYPLASYGVLATMVCAVWLCVRTLRRANQSWIRIVGFASGLYVSFMFLLSVSSFLGWAGLTKQVSFLQAGSNVVGRGLVVLSQEGYWWKQVYERFPGSLGGEADVSVFYLVAACAYLALSVAASYWMRKEHRLSPGAWLFEDRRWLLIQIVLVAVSGMLLGFLQGSRWTPSLVNVLSLLIFLVAWISAVMGMLGKGDERDLLEDERLHPSRPLVQGIVSPSSLEEGTSVVTGLALIGAWLLGWPVFVSVLLFMVGQYLYQSPLVSIKKHVPLSHIVLGFTWLMVWVSGWFFFTQQTEMSRLPLALLVGMWLFFASQTIWKSWLHYEQSGVGAFQGVVERWGRARAQWIMAGIVGGGYLIPAMMVRSWFWFCFSAAIGFATVLILLSKKPRSLELRGLFAVFLVVSLFILGR